MLNISIFYLVLACISVAFFIFITLRISGLISIIQKIIQKDGSELENLFVKIQNELDQNNDDSIRNELKDYLDSLRMDFMDKNFLKIW